MPIFDRNVVIAKSETILCNIFWKPKINNMKQLIHITQIFFKIIQITNGDIAVSAKSEIIFAILHNIFINDTAR